MYCFTSDRELDSEAFSCVQQKSKDIFSSQSRTQCSATSWGSTNALGKIEEWTERWMGSEWTNRWTDEWMGR